MIIIHFELYFWTELIDPFLDLQVSLTRMHPLFYLSPAGWQDQCSNTNCYVPFWDKPDFAKK